MFSNKLYLIYILIELRVCEIIFEDNFDYLDEQKWRVVDRAASCESKFYKYLEKVKSISNTQLINRIHTKPRVM